MIVVGSRAGCSGSGTVWRDGLSRSGASTSMCALFLPCVAGLGGAGWSCAREDGGSGVSQVLLMRGPCGDRSSGARWLCLGGLCMEMGGVCGLLSRLVHMLVKCRMVMDETHHVFPGGGVGELLCVCRQEACVMRHLNRCSADRFQLEVCRSFYRVFRVFG